MTDAEITRQILRDTRDAGQGRITDEDLSATKALAIFALGMVLKRNNPDQFIARKALASNTNIFTPPAVSTGFHTLTRVYDLQTNAIAISGAADNGSTLIRITSAAHGFTTGDIVTIQDVGGTTEANDTWQVTVISTTTFDLVGSTFSNAYTSGGKVYKEQDFPHINRKPSSEMLNWKSSYTRRIGRRSANVWETSSDTWYQRAGNIVIDNIEFSNDILISYTTKPTTLAEIPEDFHFGIVSWGVNDLILLPKSNTPEYPDLRSMQQKHIAQWKLCVDEAELYKFSTESSNLSDERRPQRYI